MTKTNDPDATTFANSYGKPSSAADLVEHLRTMGRASIQIGETNAEACETAAEMIETLFQELGWDLVEADVERREGWKTA